MDDIKKYEPLFGSWYVDRILGEGSFGKVYALKKSDFGKEYYSAMKVISIPQNQSEISAMRSEGMDDRGIKTHYERFVSEVVSEFDLMSRFRGTSNIVSYEDHLVTPRREGFGYDIFIRMELLTSLVKKLEQNDFSKKDVIQLGIDICKALELCQKHNIIHRDIKPENIFVSDHGDYKLGDFGIARTIEKTTGEMSKKGTYTYMAPEVYKGEIYGSDVDIYSLGIVLYRLLNGNRTPFLPQAPAPITHTDREIALARRMSGEKIPPLAGVEGRLAEIVMKAVEYNPKDRFISPLQMRIELENIMYTEKERKIIYPAGDRVELPENQYADSKGKGGAAPTIADIPMPPRGAYAPAAHTAPKTGNPKLKLAVIAAVCLLCLVAGVWFLVSKLSGGGGGTDPTGGDSTAGKHPTGTGADAGGNTGGNISNGGLAAKGGDFVYYRGNDEKLYKIQAGGTEKTKLGDDSAEYINVIGEWAYYRGGDGGLYKIKADGTEKTRLGDDSAEYINVSGGWAYYRGGGGLYKIKTDGTEKTKLGDDSAEYINVAGEWVYYRGGDGGLYKIKTDGTGRTKLGDDRSGFVGVSGGWIYYINETSGNKLYKIKTDGSGRARVGDAWYNLINVSGDWIYYTTWEDSDRLYKMKTDGTGKTQLNDDRSGYVSVAGDWVFYRNWDDGNRVYKIRTDGTERQPADEGETESKDTIIVYITYVRTLQNMSADEAYILDRYDSVSGANYTDDLAMYNALSDDIIPATQVFLENLKKITSESRELRDIHQLYISVWEKEYEAFALMLAAIDSQDVAMVETANGLLDEARELTDEFMSALENYGKRFG